MSECFYMDINLKTSHPTFTRLATVILNRISYTTTPMSKAFNLICNIVTYDINKRVGRAAQRKYPIKLLQVRLFIALIMKLLATNWTIYRSF